MRLSSFRQCNFHPTAKVDAGCAFTKVTMGRYSYVGGETHIGDTEIGSFCSIGRACEIGGGIHPMDTVSTSPVFLNGRNIMHKNFAKHPYESSTRVIIEHDVWIGEGAYIKSGVHIGSGAVIGSHAVVTRDVEPYAIVAGCPARMIRKRFDDATVQALLRVKWWEWSDNELEQRGEWFVSPGLLLSKINEE